LAAAIHLRVEEIAGSIASNALRRESDQAGISPWEAHTAGFPAVNPTTQADDSAQGSTDPEPVPATKEASQFSEQTPWRRRS
jgi:hypothetical protein